MNIVFLVTGHFPYGEAGSVRAMNLCKLLNDAGHIVHVIADYRSSEDQLGYCTYEGVGRESQKLIDRKIIADNSIKSLKHYCGTHNVDAVIMNARFDRYFKVCGFCNRNKIKLIVENCEWYHWNSFKLGPIDPRYWKNQRMIKHGFKKADGFISISRLLDSHNASFGVPSVRIPTIMDLDVRAFGTHKITPEKIHISYAGSPGRSKEFLRPILEALKGNEELKKKIVFNIYGPNKKQVEINLKDSSLLDGLEECVFIHGRVPQNQMEEIFRESDFLIFIRPDRRSSNAGFPTKLGESMSVGTPVITNDTGDISLYLKSGYNGFLVEGINRKSVESALLSIINMTDTKYQQMRANARDTAEKNFDYRKYVGDINNVFAKS